MKIFYWPIVSIPNSHRIRLVVAVANSLEHALDLVATEYTRDDSDDLLLELRDAPLFVSPIDAEKFLVAIVEESTTYKKVEEKVT